MPEWKHVESSDDIALLMNETCGFHDSVLKSLSYTSGAYVNSDKGMYPEASLRQLSMCFDSQCCDSFELLFERVTALNLRPAGDNYTEEVLDVTLLIREAIK
jgi:hypothetical protein